MHPIKNCGLAAASFFALNVLSASLAHAQSQVTLYGVTAIEMVSASNVNTGTSVGSMYRLDNSQVSTSRLGVRGSEDLGGGTTALFGLESGLSLDTGTTNAKFWNRGAYVGAKGAFGTVTAGRLWNLNDDLMGKYFIFGGYAAFRYTEFGFISGLIDNAVKYASPEFGGFHVRALVAAGEGVTGRTVEAGGQYASGPFAVAVTYREAKNLAGTKADKLASGGVSYTTGPVRLHAGYSAATPDATGLPKAKSWDIGVVYTPMAPLVLTLDLVTRDQDGTSNDSKFVRLGADYFLSKRTSIIANLIALENKGTAKEAFYGNGAAGKNQNIVALGLRHTF